MGYWDRRCALYSSSSAMLDRVFCSPLGLPLDPRRSAVQTFLFSFHLLAV